MKTKITTEQIEKLGTYLDEVEIPGKKELQEAMKETDTTVYPGLEEATEDIELGGMMPIASEEELAKVEETDDDYKKAFSYYGITERDIVKMMNIIVDYKANPDGRYYDRLPKSMKTYADSFGAINKSNDIETNARELITSFITDAKFNSVVDKYQKEMLDLCESTESELSNIMESTIDEMMAKIEEIKEEDPDKAQSIIDIKEAFDASKKFDEELAFLDRTNKNKLKKLIINSRAESELRYFDNYVFDNIANIEIPSIFRVVPIIYAACPDYKDDTYKIFITIMVKLLCKKNIENLPELAYVYKHVDNIVMYESLGNYETDNAKELFGNISKVLDKIESM